MAGGYIVAEVYTDQFLADWQDITSIRKPIIAAVSGFAVSPSLPLSTTKKTTSPIPACAAENSSAAGASWR